MEKALLQEALYTKDGFNRRCLLEIKAKTTWLEMSASAPSLCIVVVRANISLS